MAIPGSPSSTRTPLQKAARTANVWGWSYVVTILAVYFAPSTPPGILREVVIDTSVLFFVIGVLELVWRHFLIKTQQPRWGYALVLNEVAGTLALWWNVSLLLRVPESMLVSLITPDIKNFEPFFRSLGHPLTEFDIELGVKTSRILTCYGVGSLLFIFQLLVIWRYFTLTRQIARMPRIPPKLQ
jgi:hypothetical protein